MRGLRPLGLLGLLRPLGLLGLLGRLGPLGLLRPLGLLCLVACSEGPEAPEVPALPPSPIAFGGTLASEEAVTRAETPLSASVQTFRIYGYKNMSHDDVSGFGDLQQVFPGYRVHWTENSANSSTTNTHGWEYVDQQSPGEEEQTIKYWDWNARAYRFFATTAENPTMSLSPTVSPTVSTLAYRVDIVNDVVPYYSQLWFSTGNATLYPDKKFGRPVTLVFVKPISRVRFIFNCQGDLTRTHLSGVTFAAESGTVCQAGTFQVSYPLTGTQTKEYDFSVTDKAKIISFLEQDYYESDDPNDTNKEHWYEVLPAKGQGAYKLSLSVDGAPKSTIVPAEYMDWLPGYEYTYIFKVSREQGVEISSVNAAFTGWTEVHQDHTVYNW